MDLKRLAPWNWFKKEEEHQASALPVQRSGHHQDYNPIAQFHQEIDRLFDSLFRGAGLPTMGFGRAPTLSAQSDRFKPTLDVAANDKEYTISVELPGVDEKDVQLELSDDTLVIKGEKRQEKEEKDKYYCRRERSYGSFQRVLSLPEDAEQEGIAAYRQGILSVTIPRKAKAAAKSRQIDINKG